MKVFTVVEPIFKTEPLFILDCTRPELGDYLRRRFRLQLDEERCEIGGQMLTFQRAPWRVVWAKSGSAKNAAIVLHEVFHLVTRICADRGIPIVAHHPSGECGDETAAYLFEYFSRAVLCKLRKT